MYVYVYLTCAYIILLNYPGTYQSHEFMKKVTKYIRPVFEFHSMILNSYVILQRYHKIVLITLLLKEIFSKW